MVELGWVGAETEGVFEAVPDDLEEEAVEFAKSALSDDDDDDE